tara:strand:- start:1 stop:153 length:153 start_codon:yes stop_codon:yes gene_type:complete
MSWEGLANIVDENNRPNEIYMEAWEKLQILNKIELNILLQMRKVMEIKPV